MDGWMDGWMDDDQQLMICRYSQLHCCDNSSLNNSPTIIFITLTTVMHGCDPRDGCPLGRSKLQSCYLPFVDQSAPGCIIILKGDIRVCSCVFWLTASCFIKMRIVAVSCKISQLKSTFLAVKFFGRKDPQHLGPKFFNASIRTHHVESFSAVCPPDLANMNQNTPNFWLISVFNF